ncbi:MAG TPA: hypothetical protein VM840_07045 [Actinomycetota bacterium]|nr:hypothetical protein [Actinomycetota bacterium]
MARINLLPPEIRARQRQRRLLTIVGGVGAAILVFLAVIYFIQRGTIGDEQQRLEQLQAQRGQLETEVAALQQFGDLQQTVEQRRSTLAVALTNDIAWSRYLNDLSLIMPDNSWLVNMSLASSPGQAPTGEQSFGTVTFSGFVFDFPGLAGWLTRVGQLDGLAFLYLTNGTRTEIGTNDVVSFASNAYVTAPLLSQRCQGAERCP